MIAALLLAAGESTRFGGSSSKLLAALNGKPIVRWSAEALSGAPVDEVIVVMGRDDDAIRRALHDVPARFVVHPEPGQGMGTSIARGVAALRAETDAVLIVLADEPFPSRAARDAVVARWRAGGVAIVVPEFRGVRGHPVLFDRATFPELRTLTGDRGAREVVGRTPSRVAVVAVDEPPPRDIDTRGDLEAGSTQLR